MFASHYESGGDIIEINGKLFKQFYGKDIIDYIISHTALPREFSFLRSLIPFFSLLFSSFLFFSFLFSSFLFSFFYSYLYFLCIASLSFLS